ncbi:MAG: hypothetical protein ACJ8AJ_08375 [Gemmatimonadaceae bacterium]
MTRHLADYAKPLASIAALGFLAACGSDVTGGNRHNVQLSFTTNATVLNNSATGVAADLVVGADNELVLQKVQLVFGKLELDRRGDANCVGEIEDDNDDLDADDGDDINDECEEVELDPLLVDVPVDDALHPVITVPLPAGTFNELEAKLQPARERFTAFNTTNANLAGKSVRVEGTFKGTPFVFTSPVRANLEMEFDPPLVIDETTRNATVSIDVRRWFLDSEGRAIDPSTATPGSTNLLRIENNIRRSFHAFEDDEERGEDHHQGHGNDDGEVH